MRYRELLFALAFVVGGAALAYVLRVVLGSSPSPVVYYSMVVIGLGGALVAVRYGRLGPFDGELGSPRVEAAIREQIAHETDRASRYGREFTIVAVRQQSGSPYDVRGAVRLVDCVIPCRKGVTLVLLPETSVEGGMNLLRRMTEQAGQPLGAAIVSYPLDASTGNDLAHELLRTIRESARPGHVILPNRDSVRSVPISV